MKENTLTPVQTLAIDHLLQGNDLQTTALLIGKNKSTLTRWMRLKPFTDLLNEGRSIALGESSTRLAKSSFLAVCELEKLMLTSDRDEIRLKASCEILSIGLRLSEHLDLVNRIAALELVVESQNEN